MARGAGLKLLRLSGGRGPMADRFNAVGTPLFWWIGVGWACGGAGSSIWGCWVGAGLVLVMGFASGEVLLLRRAWWQRLVPLMSMDFW